MKKNSFLTLILIAACNFFCPPQLPGGNTPPEGSTAFTVVFNNDFTPQTARMVSLTGKLPGRRHSFSMPENSVFNLKNLKPDYKPVTDKAIVFFEIYSPRKRKVTFGLAADYWYTCYVNGKLVGTSEPRGENVADISALTPFNRVYPAELDRGINRIAIHTRPGNSSWNLAWKILPTLENWPAEKSLRDDFYTQLNTHIIPQAVTGPFVMQNSTASAAVALKMNFPEAVFIQYKIRGSKKFINKYNTVFGRIPRQERHRFELDGLQPGSVYEYRIISADAFGKIIASGTFNTLPEHGEKQSFTVFSDTQTSFAMREKVVRAMAQHEDFKKSDMFVSLGDVAGTFDDFDRSYFSSYFLPIMQTSPGKLIYPVRGNHEYRGKESDIYHQWFGRPYYAFRNGDVFYIVLDTGDDKPFSIRHAYTWRTRTEDFFAEQKAWLKKITAGKECQSAKKRIVLAHTTPFEWEKKYYAKNINYMCKEIFFGKNPSCRIDLWICGDIHSPYRFDPVTGIMAGAKRRATAKRTCRLTANDRKNIRFPVYVNDGPRGAGVDFSSTRVEIDGDTIRISCRDWQGKLLDKIEFTPGKPFKVLDTTFEKYIPWK